MVGKAYDPLLAVGAGAGAGGIVYLALPTLPAWGSAALLWTVGVALAIRGYRLVPAWDVSAADEASPWTIATRRGWVLTTLALSCGLAAVYVLFARFVLVLPPSAEVWFMVTMAATGPMIAGLTSWWASDADGGVAGQVETVAS